MQQYPPETQEKYNDFQSKITTERRGGVWNPASKKSEGFRKDSDEGAGFGRPGVPPKLGDLLDIIEKYPEKISEIQREYMYLLSGLTLTTELTPDKFLIQVKKISEYGSIVIAYSNDLFAGIIKILGTGTLIVEPKLIHGGKSVGHIEDVVVHPDYRKQGISGKIMEHLKRLAIQWNCYKIILDCAPSLKPVYEKSGFRQKSIQMAYYIEDELDMVLGKNRNARSLIPDCPFATDFIQRNGYSTVDPKLFIYFSAVQEEIPFSDEKEQDKIRQMNELLRKQSTDSSCRILYIAHMVDLVQKYKFVSRQNVDFLYISTISQLKGSRFEWEKDNAFLDILGGTPGSL
jgi:glucosamine-phosphate N-acetyltransferase